MCVGTIPSLFPSALYRIRESVQEVKAMREEYPEHSFNKTVLAELHQLQVECEESKAHADGMERHLERLASLLCHS